MKPLTLEETRLKEQMKERCLAKGQYIDENAKAKFDMLCHLEDFEVQYWELQQENEKYKEVIDKAIEYINDNLIISSILDGKKYYTINDYSFDYRELLDILKEVE